MPTQALSDSCLHLALPEREAFERMDADANGSPYPTFILDVGGKVVAWNAALERLTQVRAADVIGSTDCWRGFYASPRQCLASFALTTAPLAERFDRLRKHYPTVEPSQYSPHGIRTEGWFDLSRGCRRYLVIEAAPLLSPDGKVVGAAEVLLDRTEERCAHEHLSLVAQVFNHSLEGILVCNERFEVVEVNEAYERMTGYSRETLMGGANWLLGERIRNEGLRKEAYAALERAGAWEAELNVRDASGRLYLERIRIRRIDSPRGTGSPAYIGTFLDVTSERKAAQRIMRLAHYDALTDLPNRAYFSEKIAAQINQARRTGEQFAVLFLDLDRFKTINDSLGHRTGDQLLRGVARRLRSAVRSTDIISRQGGDEFVVMLTGLSNPANAAKAAQKIVKTLTAPFELDGHTLVVTTSIGIATYPHDGTSQDELLKHADTAMYYAKSQGRANFKFFTAELNARARETLSMESRLRQALAGSEFMLHYQPQVSTKTGDIMGVEALIRWEHPAWGMTPPDKFIPLAEEIGLIVQIGEWVLEEACAQACRWRSAGIIDVPVSVNVAAAQLHQSDIVKTVQNVLTRTGHPADKLVLELTEGSLLKDSARVQDVLRDLREMGVRIAIDDFGTGYSSLTYLKRFPVHQLKLDKAFVKDIHTDEEDAAICRTIIDLARTLKLELVAEGVELNAQREFLLQLSCALAQGYLYAPPLSPGALEAFALAKHKKTAP